MCSVSLSSANSPRGEDGVLEKFSHWGGGGGVKLGSGQLQHPLLAPKGWSPAGGQGNFSPSVQPRHRATPLTWFLSGKFAFISYLSTHLVVMSRDQLVHFSH